MSSVFILLKICHGYWNMSAYMHVHVHGIKWNKSCWVWFFAIFFGKQTTLALIKHVISEITYNLSYKISVVEKKSIK